MSEAVTRADDKTSPDYKDDLDKIASALSNSVVTLASVVSRKGKFRPHDKNETIYSHTKALRDLLIYSFNDAGKKWFKSLAVLDTYADMHNRLVDVIKQRGIRLEDSTQRHDIDDIRRGLIEFGKKHQAAIAREFSGESYKADTGIISATVNDLHSATEGKWSPVLIWTDDYCGTGQRREVERPRSAILSGIAARAGGSRLETVKQVSHAPGGAPGRPVFLRLLGRAHGKEND